MGAYRRICKKFKNKKEGGPSVKAALNLLVLRKSLERSTLSGRSLGAGITFCRCLSCSLPSNAFYFLLAWHNIFSLPKLQ